MSLYPTAERRIRILETLIERRHEKIGVLAEEFQVCRSTISSDYRMLSVYHPLYTKCGKYGGIFVMDGYSLGRKYLSDEQADFLEELLPLLSEDKKQTMVGILKKFKKPVLENKRKLNFW
jgi:predicted DNA-binding transcriptional regulator YafY